MTILLDALPAPYAEQRRVECLAVNVAMKRQGTSAGDIAPSGQICRDDFDSRRETVETLGVAHNRSLDQ
jgi:hypothetical protein